MRGVMEKGRNEGGMDILVTNNPLVKAQCQGNFRIEFIEADLQEILTKVRDYIHKGHHLLTHPLMGSVKPNESPYKSVLITETSEKPDLQSVNIIEECIQTAQKFVIKQIPEQYLNDLQTIDLSLIKSAIK